MKKSENALPSAARTLPESLRSPVVLSDPDGVDEAIASRAVNPGSGSSGTQVKFPFSSTSATRISRMCPPGTGS